MLVADAIADGGYLEARHAFEIAGGEPAEAAIAERGIGLHRPDGVEIDAEFLEGGANSVVEAEVGPDCPATAGQ